MRDTSGRTFYVNRSMYTLDVSSWTSVCVPYLPLCPLFYLFNCCLPQCLWIVSLPPQHRSVPFCSFLSCPVLGCTCLFFAVKSFPVLYCSVLHVLFCPFLSFFCPVQSSPVLSCPVPSRPGLSWPECLCL